jgi:hypothetical protein
VDAADLPPEWIGVRPGRSLIWSPAWPCSQARVLFDRHSGDFWILDGGALQLVMALQSIERLRFAQFCEMLQASGGDALAHVAALVKAGVVRAWDTAGRPMTTIEPPDVD